MREQAQETVLLEGLWKKLGGASGAFTCHTSALYTREDIVQQARIGLLRAIREFDSSKKTKTGRDVNLESWCMLVMRSHVNACRHGGVWKRENTVANADLSQFARVVGRESSSFETLLTMVERSLAKRSKRARVVFGMRYYLQLTDKQIRTQLNITQDTLATLLDIVRDEIRICGGWLESTTCA